MNLPLSAPMSAHTERLLRRAAVYFLVPALCLLCCLFLAFFQVSDGFLVQSGLLGEDAASVMALLHAPSLSDPKGEESEPMFLGDDLSATEGLPYIGELPAGVFPILEEAIQTAGTLLNGTENDLDMSALASAPYPFTQNIGTEPLVLVLHTHATESYCEPENLFSAFVPGQGENVFGYYRFESDTRSYDTTKSVVAVGKTFSETLNSLGIPTLHCETLHDAESYQEAYNRSLQTIESTLAAHPSIRYIIDLHRDSLFREDSSKLKPTTVVDGEKTAQVMLVVGCGGTSAAQPHWRDNLALSLKWQQKLREISPEFSRALYLRYGRFNQQTTVGTMLLEVGSCGNTLEEARRAGKFSAEALAKLIHEHQPN